MNNITSLLLLIGAFVGVSPAPAADFTINGFLDRNVFAGATITKQEILLEINSSGGYVIAADSIIKTIYDLQKVGITVKCRVVNRAWSAALFVLAACSKRTYVKGSTLMFHEVRFVANGSYIMTIKDLLDRAEELRQANQEALRYMGQSLGVSKDSPSLRQLQKEGNKLDPELFVRAVGASTSWITKE